ncbi:hypothetical protein [Paenibacillus sp. FJAT-26967]|uniref:hypothetical protein n=1 Tax=Paenibacillus sp. FJAT-26967 TaxID=1729690 RepID=UPI000838CAD1|nr:hypothetical protein [Paenibacillus sp. FJAT-26967]
MKMRHKWGAVAAAAAITMVMATGCNSGEAPDEQAASTPAPIQTPAGEEKGKVDYKVTDSKGTSANQGTLEITFSGDVEFTEDSVVVKGKSNLLPTAIVRIYIEAANHTVIGYSNTVKVGEDGSFEAKLKKPDFKDVLKIHVEFKPDLQGAALEPVYGKKGEKLTGPLVYITGSGEQTEKVARITAVVDNKDKEPSGKIALEQPKWNKPADYGQSAVWMKPELTEDDKYVYIKGTSNLLEGSKLSGDIEIPNHWTSGYARHTKVSPDGSFELVLQKPKEKSKYSVVLTSKVEKDSWKMLQDTYGAEGEKFQGDLVKTYDDGGKLKKKVEIKLEIGR